MFRPGPVSRLLLCAFLQLGVLAGVPMRPEEIQRLLRLMNTPKVASELPEGEEHGDGGEPGRP